MSDRSDEATESRDTEDLLSETEDLLSETGTGAPSEDRPTAGGDAGIDDSFDADSVLSSDEPTAETTDATPEADPGSGTGTGSRLSRLASRLSVGDYFSPRAFLAALLVIGGGLLAGAAVLPFAGRIVGVLGAAFAVGLLTSERRYLEMTAAGTSVGAASTVLGNAVIAMAGSFQRVVAVGVAIGLLATVIGYYFGRDLRAGLTQDIE